MEDHRDAGCAAVRARLGEPLAATAPARAASWLLVEHPGPWPSEALPPDLPAEAAAVLAAATDAGIRPQLIRPLRDRRPGAHTVMTASVRAGNRWVERRTIIELAALTELDLEALAVGEPTGFGTRTDEPVVLVCTHGRRDVCCARLGRPLAVVLDAQMPGRVWETTHVGGDRFAPNVVALPDGSYHGDLSLADVPALVAALQRSEALLPRLRGFAGIAEPAQAADHFLRRHVGETNVDGVRVVAVAESPAGDTCVELLTGAARWCVHVRLQPGTQERLTSCAGSGTRDTPGAYVLTGLRRLG